MTDRVVSPRWAMPFFEDLPFTNKKRRDVVLVCQDIKGVYYIQSSEIQENIVDI